MPSRISSRRSVLGGLTKLGAAGRTEDECITHCARPGLTRVTERAHQRPPLETQPHSALEGVEMRVLYGAGVISPSCG